MITLSILWTMCIRLLTSKTRIASACSFTIDVDCDRNLSGWVLNRNALRKLETYLVLLDERAASSTATFDIRSKISVQCMHFYSDLIGILQSLVLEWQDESLLK